MKRSFSCQSGFTLLEAIITLIIASFLGSMLFSYFAVASRAVVPAESFQDSLHLLRVMENITSDYHATMGRETFSKWEPLKAYASDEIVTSKAIKFGHLFICVSEGVSGDSEPQWLNTDINTIEDGGVVWKEYKGELDPFISRVTRNTGKHSTASSYGEYQIAELRFIQFENNIETSVSRDDPENLLKLTIQDGQGKTLTSLFTTSY